MKTYINIALGLIFAIPGLFLLLAVLGIFNITDYINFPYLLQNYWGLLFFVLPGVFLHILYFAQEQKSAGFLFLGSLLMGWGLFFQLSYSFELWLKLWPGYVLAIALAIFENYWFRGRERGMLIAAVILSGFSAILFSKTIIGNYYTEYILSFVLIILGLIIIFVKGRKNELNKPW